MHALTGPTSSRSIRSAQSSLHPVILNSQALAQIAELKKDQARLEYRILHLVRGLNALEAAAAQPKK